MKRLTTGYVCVAGGWMLLVAAGLSCLCLPVVVGAAEKEKEKKTVVKRHIKTMDDSCNLSRLSAQSKKKQGLKEAQNEYAENSFSSATYREQASSDLKRMHEKSFGEDGLTKTNGTNVVTDAQADELQKNPKPKAPKKK